MKYSTSIHLLAGQEERLLNRLADSGVKSRTRVSGLEVFRIGKTLKMSVDRDDHTVSIESKGDLSREAWDEIISEISGFLSGDVITP